MWGMYLPEGLTTTWWVGNLHAVSLAVLGYLYSMSLFLCGTLLTKSLGSFCGPLWRRWRMTEKPQGDVTVKRGDSECPSCLPPFLELPFVQSLRSLHLVSTQRFISLILELNSLMSPSRPKQFLMFFSSWKFYRSQPVSILHPQEPWSHMHGPRLGIGRSVSVPPPRQPWAKFLHPLDSFTLWGAEPSPPGEKPCSPWSRARHFPLRRPPCLRPASRSPGSTAGPQWSSQWGQGSCRAWRDGGQWAEGPSPDFLPGGSALLPSSAAQTSVSLVLRVALPGHPHQLLQGAYPTRTEADSSCLQPAIMPACVSTREATLSLPVSTTRLYLWLSWALHFDFFFFLFY